MLLAGGREDSGNQTPVVFKLQPKRFIFRRKRQILDHRSAFGAFSHETIVESPMRKTRIIKHPPEDSDQNSGLILSQY